MAKTKVAKEIKLEDKSVTELALEKENAELKAELKDFNKIGFPSIKTGKNKEKLPLVLRVCGNVVPVVNGKAQEGDPKKIRIIKNEQAKKARTEATRKGI